MMCLTGPARGCAGGDRGRAFRTGSRRLRITVHHRRGASARDLPAPARPPGRRPGYRLRDRTVHTAAARPAARRLAAGRGRRLGGHAGTAQRRRPRPRPRGGPAAGSRRTAAVAGRQPGCGHRVQLHSPLRPRPPAQATATRCSQTARAARRPGRSRIRPSRPAPGAPPQALHNTSRRPRADHPARCPVHCRRPPPAERGLCCALAGQERGTGPGSAACSTARWCRTREFRYVESVR